MVLFRRSWISEVLYPGTRPGSTIALASVVFMGKMYMYSLSLHAFLNVHVHVHVVQFLAYIVQDVLNNILYLLECEVALWLPVLVPKVCFGTKFGRFEAIRNLPKVVDFLK